MSEVEEVIAAPHEQYAKGNKARHGIRRAEAGKRYAMRKTILAGRAAREPYRDLYKRPLIVQPKTDNWTWLKDPDLHYRMNRKSYDRAFKSGLGFITENLFGILGKPIGKVARGASDALFDVVNDYDQGKPFDGTRLTETALKTGKDIVFPYIRKQFKGAQKLGLGIRYTGGYPNSPQLALEDFVMMPIGGDRNFDPDYVYPGQGFNMPMYSPYKAPTTRTRPYNSPELRWLAENGPPSYHDGNNYVSSNPDRLGIGVLDPDEDYQYDEPTNVASSTVALTQMLSPVEQLVQAHKRYPRWKSFIPAFGPARRTRSFHKNVEEATGDWDL